VKRRRIIFTIVVVVATLLFAFLAYQIYPVKFALKPDDLTNLDKPYYLVKATTATVSTWTIVGDQDGYYSKVKYVDLNGEVPYLAESIDFLWGGNTFVCYGEYVEEIETISGETISSYRLTGWDILYPINRYAIFPFWPKSWLAKMDMDI
jgi:hypothetical protein